MKINWFITVKSVNGFTGEGQLFGQIMQSIGKGKNVVAGGLQLDPQVSEFSGQIDAFLTTAKNATHKNKKYMEGCRVLVDSFMSIFVAMDDETARLIEERRARREAERTVVDSGKFVSTEKKVD